MAYASVRLLRSRLSIGSEQVSNGLQKGSTQATLPEPATESMTSPAIPFATMNGIGNSILVVDLRGSDTPFTGGMAEAAGREPGLRFDQLMAIREPRREGTDAYVDIFNIDGSRAGACGNGTRCVAWVMLRHAARDDLLVETASGPLQCHRLAERRFSVDMGMPRFGWRDIPLRAPVEDTARVPLSGPPATHADLSHFSAVSMGNPHAVFFVADAAAIDLAAVGSPIEHNPMFPDRANISFAEIVNRNHIRLRTWERGAGATLACGSAACAALVAAVRAGLAEHQAEVSQRGGDLTILWRETDGHIVMTGDVVLEHEGLLPPRIFEDET